MINNTALPGEFYSSTMFCKARKALHFKFFPKEEKLNKIKEIELTAFVILDIPSGMIVKFMISGLGQ